jgi:CubicO group peptidase (beta-lactamase class C family)
MYVPMRRRFMCVILLMAAPPAVAAQDWFADSQSDAVQAFLRDNFAEAHAGMVIGLLDKHGSKVFSAGKMDNLSDQEVDGDTLFEIGSTSKTFTVLLFLELAAHGEMKRDDPVSKYLPDGVKVPSFEGKEITLLNLAAQESGLPFNADNLSNKTFPANYNDYTVGDLYAFLSEYKLPGEPGARFEYSNVGMSLLGHVMELKTGADYESLVVDRICRPLSMTSTRISLAPEMTDRLATGHDRAGRRAARMQLQVMAGAGALHSTANDLLKYVAANLGFHPTDLSPLMAEMQVVRHRNSPDLGKSATPWYDNGVYNPPGSELLGHSGGTPGFSTFIGFDKGKRRGVVVLSNQRALPSGGIGWAILQGMPLGRESFTHLVRQVEGIGTALDTDEETGLLRITKVFPKSPAGLAGLSAGLLIRKINGVSVEGKSLQECLGMMAGPAGTKVRLELVDPERKETKTLQLTKQKFLTLTR